jgi:hypothetical protein
MDEADVEAGGALADAAWGKAHPLGRQPFHGLRQVVYPQANVVERRGVHGRLLVRIERLHQVDFDLERSAAHGANVLVDIFPLADEVARHGQPQLVHPQRLQPLLGGPADGDLLNAENSERSGAHARSANG